MTKEQMSSGAAKGPTSTEYEFSPAQNLTMELLGKRLQFLGILYMILGGLTGVGGILALLHTPAQAIIPLTLFVLFVPMGLWHYKGAASFQAVVQTAGSDISNLMKALEDLRKIYDLQYWLMVVLIVLAVLAILTVQVH